MLLGGLLLSVQDSVTYEGAEGGPDIAMASDSNLLSSGRSSDCDRPDHKYRFMPMPFMLEVIR